MQPKFAFVLDSNKSYEDAIVAVRQAVEKGGWAILGGFDFGEILATKGMPQAERFRSIQVCHAGHANKMLGFNPYVALCMPCNIVVMTQSGKTKIAAVLPGGVMGPLFENDANMDGYTPQIDQELKDILTAAA